MVKKKKKCRNCGDQFTPFRTSLQKYCMIKPGCVEIHVQESRLAFQKQKEKQWKQEKQRIKKELMTVSDYLKIAQQVFNKWIRNRDKGKPCISCGKPIRNGNCDAGHLWSAGGHANVRFNELNVNAQCSRPCNKDLSGNINNYRIGFVNRHGKDLLDELDSIAKIERKYTIEELKEIIKKYKL